MAAARWWPVDALQVERAEAERLVGSVSRCRRGRRFGEAGVLLLVLNQPGRTSTALLPPRAQRGALACRASPEAAVQTQRTRTTLFQRRHLEAVSSAAAGV